MPMIHKFDLFGFNDHAGVQEIYLNIGLDSSDWSGKVIRRQD
jgi:hypothetical protein